MTDPREGQPGPYGYDPTGPWRPGYPGYGDPAYASETQYAPTYRSLPPTEQLPAYPGEDPYAQYGPYGAAQHGYAGPEHGGDSEAPPPPEQPKAPRWLWALAGASVLVVIALVIALVVVYDNGSEDTVVAPPPSLTTPSTTIPTPSTPRRTPTRPAVPAPSPTPGGPPTTTRTPSSATQTVVYTVEGEGRAINITYIGTDTMLQTEFNVLLPWSAEAQLEAPAAEIASLTIINVGREVVCTISIDGVVVARRSGAGLTVCTGAG
ncbi:putative membrane protein [Mycolicibacterium hassiacum DSM 44199]|jgi:hypothetical protein|uniref:Putative membrane protein n=1 Tax=Mycolicibacterium hassiacum (strain DSM 44199 / CIP 105218 / JCM 12690 / 3849) TaxID=1122247 RepID=K5BJE3_MYCHD|nr:MmpS family transport accessory protein [Mycolicibacterium hassiacum]EKF22964.1 putative membrane protein [Mycolicibacterium hassiacum DSM 44199]MBX5487999.1 hypothetical protein [Mycolicibacterium hassiacum]MDA4087275.1 membrane protein [Mycolicibacterium hassiacum DSM 44199]VCT89412.1 hypothetical protein MHAS_01104 [Mycolicibacterium hassiacum DSM 44199]